MKCLIRKLLSTLLPAALLVVFVALLIKNSQLNNRIIYVEERLINQMETDAYLLGKTEELQKQIEAIRTANCQILDSDTARIHEQLKELKAAIEALRSAIGIYH